MEIKINGVVVGKVHNNEINDKYYAQYVYRGHKIIDIKVNKINDVFLAFVIEKSVKGTILNLMTSKDGVKWYSVYTLRPIEVMTHEFEKVEVIVSTSSTLEITISSKRYLNIRKHKKTKKLRYIENEHTLKFDKELLEEALKGIDNE